MLPKSTLVTVLWGLLFWVAIAEDGSSSWEHLVPGTYEYLNLFESDNVSHSETNISKCPSSITIDRLRVEGNSYKLNLREAVQFGNNSCTFNPNLSMDMSMVNISSHDGSYDPTEDGTTFPDFMFWEGSLDPSPGIDVMSCEKMGLITDVVVRVVKTGDILEQLFQMIQQDAFFEGMSDTILRTFGNKATLSMQFGNNDCMFLTESLVLLLTQIFDGAEIESLMSAMDDAESANEDDLDPAIETWLPGTYWNPNYSENHDIPASVFGRNCPAQVVVKRISVNHEDIELDLQNDVVFENDTCSFNSDAKYRTITLKETSIADEYDDSQPRPGKRPEQAPQQYDDIDEAQGTSSSFSLAGYLPAVPVNYFMNCTKMGSLLNISMSITDQSPYVQFLKGHESQRDFHSNATSELANMNFMVTIGFGETICSYLTHEDVELFKKTAGEYSYIHPDDAEHGHYPREKVETLSFSQICPCQPSFPREYETRGKTEYLLGEIYEADHSYPEHPNDSDIIDFDHSDLCTTNSSFGLSNLLHTLNETTPIQNPFTAVLRGTLEKIYKEMFDGTAPALQQMLQDIWYEVRYIGDFRRILIEKEDRSCETSPVSRDSLILMEFRHALEQLSDMEIMQGLNTSKIREIMYTERRSQRFTMHMFQADDNGSFLECTYTSSKLAKTLLSPRCKPTGNFHRVVPDVTIPPLEEEVDNDHEQPSNPTFQPTTPENEASASIPFSSIPVSPSIENEEPAISPNVEVSQTPTPLSSTSPSPSSSSSSSTSASPNSSGLSCFPGIAKVELEDGSLLSMDALKVGQRIRDSTGQFSTVVLFAHSNADVRSEFVHIESGMGSIALSPSHYIFANDKLVVAEHVSVGDEVRVLDFNSTSLIMPTSVLKVGRIWRRGLFNPQTTSGSIAVYWKGNAVLASTYTAAIAPDLAHGLLSPLFWLEAKLRITIPVLSSFLVDGSAAWAHVIPSGRTHYEL